MGSFACRFCHGRSLKKKPPGETEWTKNGRYTGSTELDLTPDGVKQVESTARQLLGHGKLIDPARIAHIWISPRKRTQQTFQLLFRNSSHFGSSLNADGVTSTEEITEWDYGDYEGLLSNEIRSSRKERGLDQTSEWNIWRDGCEGGESVLKETYIYKR